MTEGNVLHKQYNITDLFAGNHRVDCHQGGGDNLAFYTGTSKSATLNRSKTDSCICFKYS